jgi:hypothetical protein
MQARRTMQSVLLKYVWPDWTPLPSGVWVYVTWLADWTPLPSGLWVLVIPIHLLLLVVVCLSCLLLVFSMVCVFQVGSSSSAVVDGTCCYVGCSPVWDCIMVPIFLPTVDSHDYSGNFRDRD